MAPKQINALPKPVREYIHQLETIADPAGIVRENMQLRDMVKDLTAEITRLKSEAVDEKEFETLRNAFDSNFSTRDWIDEFINRFGTPTDLISDMRCPQIQLGIKYGIINDEWRASVYDEIREEMGRLRSSNRPKWPPNPFVSASRMMVVPNPYKCEMVAYLEGPEEGLVEAILTHEWESAPAAITKINRRTPKVPFAERGIHPWTEAVLEYINANPGKRVLEIRYELNTAKGTITQEDKIWWVDCNEGWHIKGSYHQCVEKANSHEEAVKILGECEPTI